MNIELKEFFRSTYGKIIVGTVLGFAGIALGIRAGYALIGQNAIDNAYSSRAVYKEIDPDLFPDFKVGEPFPLESFSDSAGTTKPFVSLFAGERTILIVADLGCNKCVQLLEFWNEYIERGLDSTVSAVVCFDFDAIEISSEYASLLQRKTVVSYDQLFFRNRYNLTLLPTIVVVNSEGIIEKCIVGFGTKERLEIQSSFT